MRPVHRAARVAIVSLLAVSLWQGCTLRHDHDFSDVTTADRITVTDAHERVIADISDPLKVKAAATFITGRSDDWSQVTGRSVVPLVMVTFFHQSSAFDGFGVARDYLLSGSLSRTDSPEQIDALMRELGVPWPPE